MALPLKAPAAAAAPAGPEPRELDHIEVELLLQGVQRRYGYDFRNYAAASLRRGIQGSIAAEGVATVSGLQERVLHDPAAMERFMGAVGVHVTSLFREPTTFKAIQDEVIPLLRTYPSIRVWSAGCATGEEAYSLAVLLDEAGILDRCRLYATDMNRRALDVGRRGGYPAVAVEAATGRYLAAGGAGDLASHLIRWGDLLVFTPALRNRVTWAHHSLVTDGSFNDFHLVVCANVLIYFDRQLQAHVHQLLDHSLVPAGFLATSNRETLAASPVKACYRRLAAGSAVFQKVRR